MSHPFHPFYSTDPHPSCSGFSRSLYSFVHQLPQRCQVSLCKRNPPYLSSLCLHSYKWLDIPLFKIVSKAMILKEETYLEWTILNFSIKKKKILTALRIKYFYHFTCRSPKRWLCSSFHTQIPLFWLLFFLFLMLGGWHLCHHTHLFPMVLHKPPTKVPLFLIVSSVSKMWCFYK